MLTDAHCRAGACPPDKKRARFTDAGGLYLEASPSGSRRWFWKTYTDGKEGRMALGSYPEVTLTAARKARDAARAKKAAGVNPVQARKVDKLRATVSAGNTFKAVAVDCLELHRDGWSASHYTRELRNLENDLYPHLGARPIADVEPVELLAVIQKVEARGVTDVPHRVLITARGVWQHAIATGRAQRDVTQDIKKALRQVPWSVIDSAAAVWQPIPPHGSAVHRPCRLAACLKTAASRHH